MLADEPIVDRKGAANTDWKVGDWVAFDRSIGQIKELREDGMATFSDGFFEASGQLVERFRPLTLKSKRIVESFDIYYNRLRDIDGESGFNYPDISRYFSALAMNCIDGDNSAYKKAQDFVQAARGYLPVIDGIRLFRRKLTRRHESGSTEAIG